MPIINRVVLRKAAMLVLLPIILLLFYSKLIWAQPAVGGNNSVNNGDDSSGVINAAKAARLGFYLPTYALPWYYTQMPDSATYANNTPDNQGVKKNEFAFQLSLKVPLWENFFSWPDTLYFAYTQNSFWQLYNQSPFFRETNYQPEFFLSNRFDKKLPSGWLLHKFDVGVFHQSNGRGGALERSWNRAYVRGIFTHDNWMVSLQPWYIFPDASIRLHNPDIAHYMGRGQTVIAFRSANNQVVSLMLRNEVESGLARGAESLSWSFPLVHHQLRGYVYAFSGYGQSLIEYNHYTNAVGVGLSFNDWQW